MCGTLGGGLQGRGSQELFNTGLMRAGRRHAAQTALVRAIRPALHAHSLLLAHP